MSKREALETIRESIRQLRIERDNGNNDAHEHILKLTVLITRISALPSKEAVELAAQYGIE